ncbi:TadE family type IV pilus minor pilin [Microbacterium sp. LWO12-1.2]|uniref:TadE family type IV pilus minor pilin n=1 Tax=Microbacterium sp. LWO12-1.2 TaxID=3135261 RepID=UPI003435E139
MALPAVVLTIALGVGALGAAARQVALQDAAADAARVLGRGETDEAAARIVSGAVPGAGLSSSRDDDLVCVTTKVDAEVAGLIRLSLRARSCALDGGG